MKKYLLLMIGFCLATGFISARAPLRQNTHMYTEGRIAKRVEVIFKDMSMSAHQKKILLTAELESAESLHMNEVARSIRAYLGLADAQVKSSEAYVAAATAALSSESDVVAGSLGDDTDNKVAQELFKYGATIIKMSQPYTKRFEMLGVPSIIENREASFALLMQQAETNLELQSKIETAIEGYKKLETLRNTTESFIDLTKRFLAHLEQKYAASTRGITEEISFKLFETLLAGAVNDSSFATLFSGFVSMYNSYVGEALQISQEELVSSTAGIVDMILSGGGKAEKYGLFLVSFAMEHIKENLKREPLLQELSQSLTTQTAQALKLLSAEGIVLTAEEQLQPLVIASYCSDYLKQNKAKNPEEFLRVVEHIAQLMSDYQMVMSEVADKGSLARMKDDFAQLSSDEKQAIQDSSLLSADTFVELTTLESGFPQNSDTELQYTNDEIIGDSGISDLSGDDETDYYGDEFDPKPQSAMSRKAIVVTTAIAVLVIGALWETLGRAAETKDADAHSFWALFKSIGKPSSFFSSAPESK